MLNTQKTALERNRFGHTRSQTKSTNRKLAIALVVATGVLGGCASYSKDHVKVGSIPGDYRSNHPIIVSENDVIEDIPVPTSAKSLSLRDESVVQAFAMRFRRSGAKSVRVVVPSGSRNEMAARRMSHKIISVLKREGVPAHAIRTLSYHASEHGDAATVRLIYSSLTAGVASECGKWDSDLAHTPENKNYSNFGCATQSNLATMVANPADLVGPRGESEIDAERRDTVIDEWRDNGTPDLPSLL